MLRKIVELAALWALATALPAAAQDQSQAMRAMVEQTRAVARQMRGQLPDDEIAEMLRSADEIEQQIAAGAFVVPERHSPATLVDRIRAEHGGRLDWLMKEIACSGFSWETADFFRMQTGDRDDQRNALCAAAWREFRTYFLVSRNAGGTPPEAMAALERYERAAHAAVDFYARK